MFDTHFGLTENPFHVIPSQKFYFPSLQHEHICHQLVDNIWQRQGLTLLTGQTGSGKTLTIKQVISQLSSSTTVLVHQNQPNLQGLMIYLQKTLNLDESIDNLNNLAGTSTSSQVGKKQDLSQLIQDIKTVDINQLMQVVRQQTSIVSETKITGQNPLSSYLEEQFKLGRNVVLFIDNISDIEKHTLDTLLALSQFDTTLEPLLNIVISCSPETGIVLHQHYEDNVTICQLLPLQNKEIAPYIDHLLRIAGYTDKFPFTSEATRKIAAHSQGIPSLINYLCRSALFTASFDQQQTITAEMIDIAACSYVNQTNNEIVSVSTTTQSGQKQPSQNPNNNEFTYESTEKNAATKPTTIKQKAVVTSKKLFDKKIIRIPVTTHKQKKKQSQEKSVASLKMAEQKLTATGKSIASPRILHPVHTTDKPEVRIKEAHSANIKKKAASVTLKQKQDIESEKRVSQKMIHTVAGQCASKVKKSQSAVSAIDKQCSARKTNNSRGKSEQAACTRLTSSIDNIVRSTSNEEQSQETWRMAVYDSLLLFVTIGCVVTLYQFQAKGINNLHARADVLASWNDLEQLERSTSLLTKKVVLRIANLNPFDFKIMPALAAAFFKEQGANSVDTRQSGTDSRTIVQGHFKKNSGTTVTQVIEIEPVSIDSKYKGMTTGKANLGISLTPLSKRTLSLFRDKNLRSIIPNKHALALAGVAVIVHPSNPVNDLSTKQIADIFQGKIKNWQYLDSKSGHIHIHTLGGEHEYLQNVLANSLGNIKIIKTIHHDTPEQLIKAMTGDIHSVGLVNVTDIGNMKALAISAKDQKAIRPSLSNLSEQIYPLAQTIHIYELNTHEDTHTSEFLKFIYSDAVQTIFEQNGLSFAGKKEEILTQKNTKIDPEIFYSLTEQAQQLSSNIRFNSTMAVLNDVAQKQIDRVTDLLKQLNLKEDKLVILGYSYNSEFSNSNLTISEARAEAVAQAFEARGIVPAVVKGMGSWNPNGEVNAQEIDRSHDQLPDIQIWTNL